MALGSNSDKNTGIKVKFDQSFYSLDFSSDLFRYDEATRTYRIKIKNCNRSKVYQIEKTYKSLLADHLSQPPRVKTKYDVEVADKKKKIQVPRGSHFGTWLRDMPKKIMYINAETQVSCTRK